MLSRLKALFRKAQPATPRIQLVTRDPYRLTVDEWRADPEMCKVASRAMGNADVRLMLDCLRNSHLAMFHGQRANEERAFHHAQCEGYSICLNTFEALTKYKVPEKELEATFEPQEV